MEDIFEKIRLALEENGGNPEMLGLEDFGFVRVDVRTRKYTKRKKQNTEVVSDLPPDAVLGTPSRT